MFIQVSQDEIPQVRKVAAITLNDMIKMVPKVPEGELFKIFAQFFKDEQDSVKMQGIDSCVVFCKHMPQAKVAVNLLPYIKKYAEDKSWRIRYLVADRIMDLSQGLGFEQAREHLLPSYCNFLQDTESEVRTAAVGRLSDFCRILDPASIINKVIPCLKKL